MKVLIKAEEGELHRRLDDVIKALKSVAGEHEEKTVEFEDQAMREILEAGERQASKIAAVLKRKLMEAL